MQKRQALFTPYTAIAGLADFLLNVGAVLFSFTIYSSAPLALALSLLCPAILLLVLTSTPSGTPSKAKQEKKAAAAAAGKDDSPVSSSKPSSSSSSSLSNLLPVRPFLTHYRGSMMISTCLAILAVDFPIFPRRFAKVETWGTSLMDLGVGSFVFSAGVVSARAVVKARTSTRKAETPTPGFLTGLVQAVRHSIPLLILGFIRLWTVKGLDYAEHVTEYGVHWNFFFTLALLPPFVELADPMARGLFRNYDVLAILLALTYEIVLNNTDLLRYILISPRGPDLLSKNREGVFSFIGYLAIFLAGRGTGVSIVQYQVPSSTPTSSSSSSSHKSKTTDPLSATAAERRLVLKTLAIRSAVYISLFVVSTHVMAFNLNVSRRLANLAYVLWVTSFNATQLLLCGTIESLGPAFSYELGSQSTSGSTLGVSSHISAANATSRILRAFNSNGLAIFLVANLLTGLVNLTCNTLDMPVLPAMAVLTLYAATVAAVAFTLNASGVKIRL